MKSKTELMRQRRAALKERGLVAVTCYVEPQHRARLAKYVNGRLYGECSIRPRKSKKSKKRTEEQLPLKLPQGVSK